MRKLLLSLTLFTLTLTSLASREVYLSNELGQRLELKAEEEGAGWELVVDGTESYLYENGVLYFSESRDSTSYTRTYSSGREERSEYREDGLLERRTIRREDGSEEEYRYEYEAGNLRAYTYSLDGEVVRRVEYTTYRSSLLSTSGTARAYYTPSYYSYEFDGSNVILSTVRAEEESVDETALTANEDGSYSEVRDDVTLTYDRSLRLISEEREGESIYYTYNDQNEVIERRIERAEESVEEYYSNERLVRSVTYSAGSIARERRVLEDGTYEEIRYLSGAPRYRFIYDIDGRRLIGAESL